MSGYVQIPDFPMGNIFLFKDDPTGAGVSAYRNSHDKWIFVATIPPPAVVEFHEWLTLYLASEESEILPHFTIGEQFLFKDDPIGGGVTAYRSNYEWWAFIATIPPEAVAAFTSWLTLYLSVHPVEEP